MAIQGIFLADFSQYNAAVDGADAKLRQFTSATTTHDGAVRQFNTRTTEATNKFGVLAQGLSEADRTLGTFGVHIQHEIHALEEISAAAGKTASEIGLIGTATFVAAAAMGGWELGKKIAEFTNADEAVSHWIDRTFNLAVAQEEAAAKVDALARASKTAGHEITNYNEAVQINIEEAKKASAAAVEHAKARKKEQEAIDEAAKAVQRLSEAEAKRINELGDKLIGTDDIKQAQDYMKALVDVRFVTMANTETQKDMEKAFAQAQEAMVRQGRAGTELFGTITTWRQALLDLIPVHTDAMTKMETDEARVARETAELAKAMKEDFVIIGQSAQEAAQTTATSWSSAMDQVRAGAGTMGGSFASIAPGAAGSSVRYDDYGNPYGYIPGVNAPGKISPTGGGVGGTNIFNFQDAYFDSPASQQRLAEKVTTALGTRAASQGGR